MKKTETNRVSADACPFCGHKAETKVIDRKTHPYGCLIVCYCTNCYAQTRPIEYDDKDPQKSENAVVGIWNKRIAREGRDICT